MILIGQFDSPFARRVGITMRLYGIPFEHKPWSVFGDAEKIRACNPLLRVPTLVIDDGEALIETAAIVDYLDGLVAPDKRLVPASEPLRRRVLRAVALASGVSDKAVSLFYELRLHEEPSGFYVERCRAQIVETLKILERERIQSAAAFWFGDTIGQADIALACTLRHLNEAHPGLADMAHLPALANHCDRMEAIDIFKEISQPFIAPEA